RRKMRWGTEALRPSAPAMEVPGPDSDWKSPQFRQKVVAQIEEAMRKAGTAHNKSSTDMENHVFIKAKSRDEYLSLVARLIIHFRDIRKYSGTLADPMNALTNLTGVGGGPGAMGVGPRPTGAPVGGMGAMGPMQIGQHAMAGVAGNPQPLGPAPPSPSPPSAVGGPGQMPVQQMVQAAAEAQNQQQQTQMHQTRVMQLQFQQQAQAQSIQHMVQQQVQAQAQVGQMPPHMVLQSLAGQMVSSQHVPLSCFLCCALKQARAVLQQQAAQQAAAQAQLNAAAAAAATAVPGQLGYHLDPKQTKPPKPGRENRLGKSEKTELKGKQSSFGSAGETRPRPAFCPLSSVLKLVRPGMQLPARMPRASIPPPNAAAASAVAGGPPLTQQAQQHSMMSSPSPVQAQSMLPPPQPSPQPPPSQPNSASSGPTPSPGGFQPSPSPQPSQSPSNARPVSNYSVPSPGPLNTPGNPSSVMSPAGPTSLEDQQYMEKLKQLSKYIEPLRRMINKIDKNEDRKKDLSKMKSLLNILTDPTTRCPLKTLQKCEIALEKLKNDMAVPTPPPVATKQQYLCQPLLDAVMTNIRSPVFNHSLYRTFAPAMSAIHGPPISCPSVCGRKRKQEEEERQSVPNILQGEVARLDLKFLVNLDPSQCSTNGTVHLICKLDDKNLPSVPPLQLRIPADYPEQSPCWDDHGDQYGSNSFLQKVHRTMTSKLLQLPDKHSLTELLNTWAQSVQQACRWAA
uniref:Mediator of RNA polymerase II transcription subunit 15 n=1 Tax=Tetraodon nigroviridis TaxID=99883 RepID=H3CLX6_TETNG